MEEKMAPIVRNYKDTLFRMIFGDKKQLLSLYNAVNETEYEDAEALEIVTLENAVYMNMKNDLAFIMDFELHLYEHQSTCNPNIPLRDLFYVAREYEKIIDKSTLYSSKLKRIPTPRFVVFYNGTELQPERCIYRLSDAFEKPTPDPDLELKVLMLNINFGNNIKIMESCKTLRDYCVYVKKVREYAEIYSLEKAVNQAVDECIREEILEDFLRKYRAEVVQMSIFEYDEEKEMKLIRQDEREIGKEIGKEIGVREGGIAMLIKLLRENNKTMGEIAERVQREYELTDEETEQYIEKYRLEI